MKRALHPTEDRLITCAEYDEIAAAHDVQTTAEYEKARCPVCKTAMSKRAGQRGANAHFWHVENNNCPTKNQAAKPYENLFPTTLDREAIKNNRAFVNNYMNEIWSAISEIVPYLNLKEEFIPILREAKRLNVYGYAGLDVTLIPYVYVTLINFIPSRSYLKKRGRSIQFFYEAVNNTNEGLWIDRRNFDRLIKTSSDNVEIVSVTTDYLDNCLYPLTPKQLKWMRNIF